MLEAFVVGVRLKLLDGVSVGLGMMSRGFLRAQGNADALQKRLGFIQKTALVGGGLLAASGSIFWLIDKTLPAAEAYAHQLNIMNMAGLKQVDIAKAVGAAWQTSQDVVTSTATGNLAMLMDMRNVLQGGMAEAVKMLPITAKIAQVMAASSESKISGNAQSIAFDITKAMDIMGMNTMSQMQHGAEQMSKVITAFQNRISPAALAGTLYYARQARYSPDDAFTYGVIPTMMLERAGGGSGGGSKGIGPQLAALNRVAVMGTMNRKTADWFGSLGLLHGKSLSTTTIGTQTSGLDNKADWQNNQFFATWAHLVPALMRAGIANDPKALRAAVENSAMQQTAMSQLLEYVTKPGNFLRDMSNVGVMPALKDLPPLLRQMAEQMGLRSGQGAIGYQQAYAMALANDPGTILAGVKAQWQNVLTSFGISVLPSLLNALKNFMPYLAQFSKWLNDNPEQVKKVVKGLVWLGGTLAVLGGTTLVVGGLQSLIWVFGGLAKGAKYLLPWIAALDWPITLAIGAFAALGFAIYEIVKHEKEITGFFGHLGDEIATFFGIGKGKPITHTSGPWGGSSTYAAHSKPITHTTIHTTINMDGRAVAKVVSQHMGNEASRPSTGPSGFDSNLSPLRPDMVAP